MDDWRIIIIVVKNSIKPVAISGKVWYLVKYLKGERVSTIIYSFEEKAKSKWIKSILLSLLSI